MSSSQSPNERQMYGGQAVVEGVMMRSPRYFAIACRRLSDGEIIVERENVESVTRAWQWLNKPFLRGMLALVDAVYMGTKALMYSANIQVVDAPAQPSGGIVSSPTLELVGVAPNSLRGELSATDATDVATGQAAVVAGAEIKIKPGGQPINGIVIGGTVFFALAIGYAMFWLAPDLLFAGINRLTHWKQVGRLGGFYENLSEGGIRITIFLIYIGLVSCMKHVRRVFQYHGAEHKAINTLESGLDLTVENARGASRLHPRCGTNFIFIVLIVSIFVFALFGTPPPLIRIPLHLVCVLFVVGISFEILKFAGKYRDHWWARVLIAPGLATQYLTTRVPDDSQIEVALASLRSVWDKEHEANAEAAEVRLDVEPASAVA